MNRLNNSLKIVLMVSSLSTTFFFSCAPRSARPLAQLYRPLEAKRKIETPKKNVVSSPQKRRSFVKQPKRSLLKNLLEQSKKSTRTHNHQRKGALRKASRSSTKKQPTVYRVVSKRTLPKKSSSSQGTTLLSRPENRQKEQILSSSRAQLKKNKASSTDKPSEPVSLPKKNAPKNTTKEKNDEQKLSQNAESIDTHAQETPLPEEQKNELRENCPENSNALISSAPFSNQTASTAHQQNKGRSQQCPAGIKTTQQSSQGTALSGQPSDLLPLPAPQLNGLNAYRPYPYAQEAYVNRGNYYENNTIPFCNEQFFPSMAYQQDTCNLPVTHNSVIQQPPSFPLQKKKKWGNSKQPSRFLPIPVPLSNFPGSSNFFAGQNSRMYQPNFQGPPINIFPGQSEDNFFLKPQEKINTQTNRLKLDHSFLDFQAPRETVRSATESVTVLINEDQRVIFRCGSDELLPSVPGFAQFLSTIDDAIIAQWAQSLCKWSAENRLVAKKQLLECFSECPKKALPKLKLLLARLEQGNNESIEPIVLQAEAKISPVITISSTNISSKKKISQTNDQPQKSTSLFEQAKTLLPSLHKENAFLKGIEYMAKSLYPERTSSGTDSNEPHLAKEDTQDISKLNRSTHVEQNSLAGEEKAPSSQTTETRSSSFFHDLINSMYPERENTAPIITSSSQPVKTLKRTTQPTIKSSSNYQSNTSPFIIIEEISSGTIEPQSAPLFSAETFSLLFSKKNPVFKEIINAATLFCTLGTHSTSPRAGIPLDKKFHIKEENNNLPTTPFSPVIDQESLADSAQLQQTPALIMVTPETSPSKTTETNNFSWPSLKQAKEFMSFLKQKNPVFKGATYIFSFLYPAESGSKHNAPPMIIASDNIIPTREESNTGLDSSINDSSNQDEHIILSNSLEFLSGEPPFVQSPQATNPLMSGEEISSSQATEAKNFSWFSEQAKKFIPSLNKENRVFKGVAYAVSFFYPGATSSGSATLESEILESEAPKKLIDPNLTEKTIAPSDSTLQPIINPVDEEVSSSQATEAKSFSWFSREQAKKFIPSLNKENRVFKGVVYVVGLFYPTGTTEQKRATTFDKPIFSSENNNLSESTVKVSINEDECLILTYNDTTLIPTFGDFVETLSEIDDTIIAQWADLLGKLSVKDQLLAEKQLRAASENCSQQALNKLVLLMNNLEDNDSYNCESVSFDSDDYSDEDDPNIKETDIDLSTPSLTHSNKNVTNSQKNE